MRILFVTIQTYPPQSAGGSQSSTHDLCLFLQKRGHSVAVLCGMDPRGIFGSVIRVRRKFGITHRFPVDRWMGYPTYRGWDAPSGIPEVIREFKPDVAIVQAGNTIAVARALISQGLPTVAYIRDVGFDRAGAEPFTHTLLRYVANSKFTGDRLRKVLGLDNIVIPPLVIQDNYRTDTERRSVVHINPFPQKGIDITLELARRRPDIPFEIIESWTVNHDVLDKFSNAASRLPNVTWRRPVKDMRKVYKRARIVIAPSRCQEGWGRVATEAHTSGIPVLASANGGLPESVGPGGILIDINAPIAKWEAALSTLWDNEATYQQYVKAAIDYSMRSEIQPTFLIDQLEKILFQQIGKSD